MKKLQIKKPGNEYILLMDKAFFPYGKKSKEFLLKRSLYLCYILEHQHVDEIILACNTLSLLALPFLKLFYTNIQGVFQNFLPYITPNSAFLGSSQVVKILKEIYPNHLILDGSKLIYAIEHKEKQVEEIERIHLLCKDKDNLILACTHFIGLKEADFTLPIIKNI